MVFYTMARRVKIKNILVFLIIAIVVILDVSLLIQDKSPEKENNLEQTKNKQKCGIEQCHGLDITCGKNIPDLCTAVYQVGDICRKYVKCEITKDKCLFIKDSKFEECKTCVANTCNDNPENCEGICIQKIDSKK